jgi:NADPH:quinone reductase
MKAAYIEKTGAADEIIVGELPCPPIRADQVLVKVTAAAVDPVDVYIRSGAYNAGLAFPFIIGRDMVGIVESVGKDVNGFSPGQPVWCNNQGYSGRQGTFAEYVSVDASLLYHLPAAVDGIAALATLHSALTVITGLHVKAKLNASETLFINGGSGNVGTCAIQLAKSRGATVAVTAGSEETAKWCIECGADAVFNYKTSDVASQVKDWAPKGVDVYWDLTQQPDIEMAVKSVARRGRILISSGLKHESSFRIGDFYTKNCTMFGFTITDLEVAELGEAATIINRELEKQTFNTRISRRLPLSESALAHKLVEFGEVRGKVIVTLNGGSEKD